MFIMALSIGSIFYLVSLLNKANDEFILEDLNQTTYTDTDQIKFEIDITMDSLMWKFPYECVNAYDYAESVGKQYEPAKYCTDFAEFINIRVQLNDLVDELIANEEKDDILLLNIYLKSLQTDAFIKYYDGQNDQFKQLVKDRVMLLAEVRVINDEVRTIMEDKFPFLNKIKVGDQVISVDTYNYDAMNLYENYLIYKNNLPINAMTQMTASRFLALYLDAFFLVIIVIGILLVFDTYYRDYKSGVIKTILSSPVRRYRYLFMKSISAMLSIFIIVIAPILISYIGLYIYHGYDTLSFPVYISRSTLNSFTPVKEFSKIINAELPPTFFSTYSEVCNLNMTTKFVSDVQSGAFGSSAPCTFYASTATNISYAKYLLLLVGYYFLLVGLLASINSLFSLIFKNSIVNVIALVTFALSNILLIKLFIGKQFLKLLPTTFLAPAKLLMGLTPYTYLNGVVTISIWIIALNFITYILLKQKDFTY